MSPNIMSLGFVILYSLQHMSKAITLKITSHTMIRLLLQIVHSFADRKEGSTESKADADHLSSDC